MRSVTLYNAAGEPVELHPDDAGVIHIPAGTWTAHQPVPGPIRGAGPASADTTLRSSSTPVIDPNSLVGPADIKWPLPDTVIGMPLTAIEEAVLRLLDGDNRRKTMYAPKIAALLRDGGNLPTQFRELSETLQTLRRRGLIRQIRILNPHSGKRGARQYRITTAGHDLITRPAEGTS